MFSPSIDKQTTQPRTEGGDTIRDPVKAGRLEQVDPGVDLVFQGGDALFAGLAAEVIAEVGPDPAADVYSGRSFSPENERNIGAQAMRFGNPEVN